MDWQKKIKKVITYEEKYNVNIGKNLIIDLNSETSEEYKKKKEKINNHDLIEMNLKKY